MINTCKYRVIGLMSGTSLDGLDLACVDFFLENDEIVRWNWVATECVEYNEFWQKKLVNAHLLDARNLYQLDAEYGKFLGERVLDFIKQNQIANVSAVCSHGHTIFHQPQLGYTLQIGQGAQIQSVTGLTVICDFRSHDVALGGQGAPLVPIGDKILFSEYDACINLGGFANISFEKENKRVAFDIVAVNFVLNNLCQILGLDFDSEGEIARRSCVNYALLTDLNNLNFYLLPYPKSLGREFVEQQIFPILTKYELSAEDKIATFTAHIADQISKVLNEIQPKKVLFTGGGTYNSFLIESIQKSTQAKIVKGDSQLINFKEALIFGLLGLLKLQNRINVLSSVTGAKRDSSSGIVYT